MDLVKLVERGSIDGSCGCVGSRCSEPGFEHEQRFFNLQRKQLFDPTQRQKNWPFFKGPAITF